MLLSPLIDTYDTVLLDLDGCVWVGSNPTRGAAEAISALRSAGKALAFVTNDSRHSPEEYVRKLWSIWHAPDGGTLRTCTILTVAANAAVAPLHDRMPVILPAGAEEAWLDAATPTAQLHDLLTPLEPGRTALREVSTAVNDARYDGPKCLEPPVPDGQGALFS